MDIPLSADRWINVSGNFNQLPVPVNFEDGNKDIIVFPSIKVQKLEHTS